MTECYHSLGIVFWGVFLVLEFVHFTRPLPTLECSQLPGEQNHAEPLPLCHSLRVPLRGTVPGLWGPRGDTYLRGHLPHPSKLGRKRQTNPPGKCYWLCWEGTMLSTGTLSRRNIALSILSYMWFMMLKTLPFASTSSPDTILISNNTSVIYREVNHQSNVW